MARDGNAKGMKETKFKDTELGKIPEEWEVCKVLDFTDVMTGATPSTENPDYWGGHILWMNSGELNKKFVYDVAGRITKKGYNSASTHMLPKNCVLIGLAGQGKTRGTAAINKIELCTNQSIGAILPSSDTDADYLFYFFDSQYQNLRVLSSGDGGRGGLSKGLLLNYDVIRPHDKAEQQRIASALSDVDALVAELDALIEKKRAIMAGTMQELLTGKRRLQGFSEPWVEKKFCEVGTTYNGLSGKTAADFGHGTSKYVTFVNVIYNAVVNPTILDSVDVSPTERQNAVLKEDLLLNTSSETPEEVGMCSYMATSIPNLYLNSFCFGFRVNNKDVCPLFLSYLLRSATGRSFMLELAQGSTRYNLPKRKFLQSAILLPSSLAEQHAIATILSDMDAEIAELEAKRDKYKEVRQGMMQQLLTGKIRLI